MLHLCHEFCIFLLFFDLHLVGDACVPQGSSSLFLHCDLLGKAGKEGFRLVETYYPSLAVALRSGQLGPKPDEKEEKQ